MRRTTVQPGTVIGFESVDLYAMVSGYLKEQAVDIGSRIRKGQVLAEIDAPREAKALEEAATLVEEAKAKTARPRLGSRQWRPSGTPRRPASKRRNRTSIGWSPHGRSPRSSSRGCAGCWLIERPMRLVEEHVAALDTAVAADGPPDWRW